MLKVQYNLEKFLMDEKLTAYSVLKLFADFEQSLVFAWYINCAIHMNHAFGPIEPIIDRGPNVYNANYSKFFECMHLCEKKEDD